MEILAVENLSFTYPGCSEKALDGVSLKVEEGEFEAICGATGSGKRRCRACSNESRDRWASFSGKVSASAALCLRI